MGGRLEQIAGQARGPVVADIGTDHGYLPLRLLENPAIASVVATDISAASLQKCRNQLAPHPRRRDVTMLVTDGLEGLDTTTLDSIVISGMGGHRIMGILNRALRANQVLRRLILSPQKGEEELRRFLHGNGFRIESDFLVQEEGKYYTVMVAVPGEEEYASFREYRYGRIPLQAKDPVLQKQLEEELALKKRVQTKALSQASRLAVEKHIALLKEVLRELHN